MPIHIRIHHPHVVDRIRAEQARPGDQIEPAVDGLGWYFTSAELGERPAKLKTIPEKYLKDSLQVNVCLRKTDEKYQCFCATPLDVYEVKSVRKR